MAGLQSLVMTETGRAYDLYLVFQQVIIILSLSISFLLSCHHLVSVFC